MAGRISTMPPAFDTIPQIGGDFEGKYEILSELGAGTFARVYQARQKSTDQLVAIKVLHGWRDDQTRHATSSERFRREMRLCAELSHPNIVRLIDSGESDGAGLYAVFEFVPGATLEQILCDEGRLEIREAVHVMGQVLDALACAHARGVVHRDLKPGNIMLTWSGVRRNAMVLDFGLGGFVAETRERQLQRLTATQEMMGTPSYAAPEQLRGDAPTTRSDLYSWGLILLECLTGHLAVSGANVREVILRQLGPDPIPIPAWLANHRLGHVLKTVTAKPVARRAVTIESIMRSLDLSAAADRTDAKQEGLRQGERRQMTIVSCRLAATSTRGTPVDVEELDGIMHVGLRLLGEIAEQHGGYLASVQADRALLSFGYPEAREDDARRAARAALAIVARFASTGTSPDDGDVRLVARIGVHTGLVIARAAEEGSHAPLYDLVGSTPRIAADLDAIAPPGEVVASSATVRALRGEFVAEHAGDYEAPDDGRAVPVFRLAARRQTHKAATLDAIGETPLIGRDHEFGRLLASWSGTHTGVACAVLITGDAGIGKTRLLRELRRRTGDATWLECRCVPETQHTPLGAVVETLGILAREEGLLTVLARNDLPPEDMYPLFASLLGAPADERYPIRPLSPDRQKELTLNALVTLVSTMAEKGPLVLAIEDLHWADPTTVEFATEIVQALRASETLGRTSPARLCVVFTARPEFTPRWSLADVALIPVPRLTREQVVAMVSAGLGADVPLPTALLDQVIQRADGVPLFIEEITRVLIESTKDRDVTEPATVVVDIPSSLRDLFAARLDHLSEDARDAARLAAVLGREFSFTLLAMIWSKGEAKLREALDELAVAGLLYRRRNVPGEMYVFKHALARDTAYETMMRPQRRDTHRSAAEVLSSRFPEVVRRQPEALAQHLEAAGDLAAATAYWQRAGEGAMVRGAYAEAIGVFERTLALLQRLSVTRENQQREVTIATALGMALLATQGYGSAAVERQFNRAFALCERLGDDLPFEASYGLWGVCLTRSDRQATAAFLPRFRALAERTGNLFHLHSAHLISGIHAFFAGQFASAREELELSLQWYDAEDSRAWVAAAGYDGRLYAHGYLTWVLAILGRPDEARRTAARMIELGRAGKSPYALAIALTFRANLAQAENDPAAALAAADECYELASEQKFYFWQASARCLRGWAQARSVDLAEGMAEIRRGLEMMSAMGQRAVYGYCLALLAEVQLDAGAANEARPLVDEGLALCATLLDRAYEAELLRLRGEVLHADGDTDGAESTFARALKLARDQQALAFEVRIATSLARFLHARGRAHDASTVLREVCARFPAGTDWRHLQQAQLLLEELGELRASSQGGNR